MTNPSEVSFWILSKLTFQLIIHSLTFWHPLIIKYVNKTSKNSDLNHDQFNKKLPKKSCLLTLPAAILLNTLLSFLLTFISPLNYQWVCIQHSIFFDEDGTRSFIIEYVQMPIYRWYYSKMQFLSPFLITSLKLFYQLTDINHNKLVCKNYFYKFGRMLS